MRFINNSQNANPLTRANPLDAGTDIASNERLVIPAGARAVVGTGVIIEGQDGFVIRILDRSGLAAKQGITVLAGVVDSEYRGEVKVVLLNTGDKDFSINVGDRIAQLVIQPCNLEDFVCCDEFEFMTSRGTNGFGSSGVSENATTEKDLIS